MLATAQFFLDLHQFGPHPFAHGLPPEQEPSVPALRANAREAQDFEGSFPSAAAPALVHLGEPAEHDQAGFLRMQIEREGLQPLAQFIREVTGVVLEREPDDGVVRPACALGHAHMSHSPAM